MTDIILHHYETSPYSEKVRLGLGLKGLAWGSVETRRIARPSVPLPLRISCSVPILIHAPLRPRDIDGMRSFISHSCSSNCTERSIRLASELGGLRQP
jgi:hypothetical protein